MSNNTVVIFHHSDLDGRAAASVVLKKHPKAKTYPVDYREGISLDSFEEGDEVIIVDFTPDKDFKEIVSKAGNVVWIDHHKSNIDNYPEMEGLDGLRVDSKPSGAMAAWKYYFPTDNPPQAIIYVSDFDTWTHDYPESKIFEAGMSSISHEPNDPIWDILLAESADSIGSFVGYTNLDNTAETVDEILERGRTIIEYRNQWCKEYLEIYGFETEFEGYSAICCCIARTGSDFFNSFGQDKNDLMIPFVFDGSEYVYSLYSVNKDIDCSEIAKKYGGGGHPSASGFQSKEYILGEKKLS